MSPLQAFLRSTSLQASAFADQVPEGLPVPTDPSKPPPILPPPPGSDDDRYDLKEAEVLIEGYTNIIAEPPSVLGVLSETFGIPFSYLEPYLLPRADASLTLQAGLNPPQEAAAGEEYLFRLAIKPAGFLRFDNSTIFFKSWPDGTERPDGWSVTIFKKTMKAGDIYDLNGGLFATGFEQGFELKVRGPGFPLPSNPTAEDETGFVPIPSFNLVAVKDWKARLKTYTPVPEKPPVKSYLPLTPVPADYQDPDLPADFFLAKVFAPWTVDVSDWPVDPKSSDYLASLHPSHYHPGFGPGANGIPKQIVIPSEKKSYVSFDVPDQSDIGPYPIPDILMVEGSGDFMEGNADVHCILIDMTARIVYELYNLRKNLDGSWAAYQGSVWHLDKPYNQRTKGFTSSDASGMMVLPGLLTFQDVQGDAELTRATRITVGRTQQKFVDPASHWASRYNNPAFLPMGSRLRLRPDYDASAHAPVVQKICRGWKKYGNIVVDNGSMSKIFAIGSPDIRWNDNDLGTMRTIFETECQLLQLPDLQG